MAETEKNVIGIMEKLALISDAALSTFPNGKTAIVFELNEEDYKGVLGNFRKIDQGHKKFKIDISGVEIVLILEGQYNDTNTNETPTKKSLFKRLFPFIGRKSSVKN
jgi:hypothetical protein